MDGIDCKHLADYAAGLFRFVTPAQRDLVAEIVAPLIDGTDSDGKPVSAREVGEGMLRDLRLKCPDTEDGQGGRLNLTMLRADVLAMMELMGIAPPDPIDVRREQMAKERREHQQRAANLDQYITGLTDEQAAELTEAVLETLQPSARATYEKHGMTVKTAKGLGMMAWEMYQQNQHA